MGFSARRRPVIVVTGGPSAEHDVSLASARTVRAALGRMGLTWFDLKIGRDGLIDDGRRVQSPPLFALPQLLRERPWKDAVMFLAAHGTFVENGGVQRQLERARVPYTGSGPDASALGMDKAALAARLRAWGIETPPEVAVRVPLTPSSTGAVCDWVASHGGFPCIVKPADQGSSIGVTKVLSEAHLSRALIDAAKWSRRVLVQELISGDEVTCGVLDDGATRSARALPPTLIRVASNRLFDYEAKYRPGLAQEITPAPLPEEALARVQATAVAVHRIAGARGISRTDMILCGDRAVVLEINTLPGLTASSFVPQQARAAGMGMEDVVERLLFAAVGGR
ncbi:MAG: ATP-grasp domain-containing protein [Planctomycetes bacterium]|nr:ATP-grasp domain-containing protein [Planctomycetota bacterium]